MATENTQARPRERRSPPAQYHPRLAQDFEFAFKMCATELPQKFERQIVLSELRECLDSVKLGGVEGQYELIDFSMHTWGLPEFSSAPTELVLVDTLRPEGIPQAHGSAPLPLPYCPIQLSNHLSKRGFEGSFIDMQIDYAEKQPSAKSKKDAPNINGCEEQGAESKEATLEPCWSINHEISFTESQERLPMPPACLRIKQRLSDINEPRVSLNFGSNIILYPAHPSNYHRMALLRSCCARDDFSAILSSFWLWAQSWKLDRLSPTVCALIVISYLQKTRAFPPLRTSPGLPKIKGTAGVIPTHYWTRRILSDSPEPVYYRNDLPMLPPDLLRTRPENVNSRIAEFFEFLAMEGNGGLQCKDFVFSVKEGKGTVRKVPYIQPPFNSRKNFWKRLTAKNKQFFSEEFHGSQILQSPIWQYQALVIEDPFVIHHNASHLVTNNTLSKLRKQAKNTTQLLKNGISPLETFGPAITEKHITRSYIANMGSMENFFSVVPLEPTVHERRNRTIFLVNDVVRKKYGRNYHVECFGSTRYGVDTATSDLDLVILDATKPLGFCYDANLPAIYDVRDLGKTLRMGGFRIEEVIPQAAVPIVKFYDARTRIQCDINVNDQLGLFNTQMIAHYCKLFWPLPALLLAVKKWAKSLGLNNPSGRGGSTSFSSYALTVMTIGYLQTIDILPSLQAGLPPLPPPPTNPESDVEGVFWQRERNGPPKRCDRRFFQTHSWQPPSEVKLDIHSLLLGWFRYWGHQHEYATQLMSIRDAAILARAVKAPNKRRDRKKASKKSKEKVANGTEDDNAPSIKEELSSRAESPSIGLDNLDIQDDTEEKSVESEDEDVKVEDVEAEDTTEDLVVVDLANGKQPRWWKNASLVVGDPFILTKNITGSVSQRIIERFKAECRRAVILLEHGGSFEDLLGTGETLAGRPRDSRNGRAAGGRIKPGKTVQVEAKQATTTLQVQTMVMQEHNVSI